MCQIETKLFLSISAPPPSYGLFAANLLLLFLVDASSISKCVSSPRKRVLLNSPEVTGKKLTPEEGSFFSQAKLRRPSK